MDRKLSGNNLLSSITHLINIIIFLAWNHSIFWVYFRAIITLRVTLKGSFTQKSFTHPHVVPNLYECICSAEQKGRYSEECGRRSSSGAPLTFIVFFSYFGSQRCLKTAWLQTFFRISSFVFSRTKTFIQVWNYLRGVSDDRIFIFGRTIPLRMNLKWH